ncbi:ribosomal protein S2 [Peniophora sp. CONT]|nr:ribosomal protein S2 [Peniophora sp. CONT]
MNSLRTVSKASRSAQRRYSSNWVSNKRPEKLETVQDWTNLSISRTHRRGQLNFLSNFGSEQTRTWKPHMQLHKATRPRDTTLNALVAAGAHFGHSTSLMNPHFIPYAYGARAGITVIDMDQTLPMLRRAASVVRGILANDGTILFVGTRPDLGPAARKAAQRVGDNAYYVANKWTSGLLTNRTQFYGDASVDMRVVPDCVVVLNPLQNMHALRECALEHVPTIGIIDSNVDPRIVMYPIPANDESTRTAELIAGVLSIAAREGLALRKEEHADDLVKELASLTDEDFSEESQDVELEGAELEDSEQRLADLTLQEDALEALEAMEVSEDAEVDLSGSDDMAAMRAEAFSQVKALRGDKGSKS